MALILLLSPGAGAIYAFQVRLATRIPAGPYGGHPAVCHDLSAKPWPEVTFHGANVPQWQIWAVGACGTSSLLHADTAKPGQGVLSGFFVPLDAGDSDMDGCPDILGRNFNWTDTVHTGYWNVVAVMEAPMPGSLPLKLVWLDTLNYNSAEFGHFYYLDDVDGDGRQEILAVEHHNGPPRSGTIIYENRGDNQWQYIWSGTRCGGASYAVGDFDLDGRVEIVSCSWTFVRAIECTGDDEFWVPPWVDSTPYTNGIDVFSGRDVDQNGKPEFFVSYARWRGLDWMHYLYGWEAVGRNEYRQFFVDSVSGEGGERTSRCGDVDGDGVDEVLFSVGSSVNVYKATDPGCYVKVHTWQGTACARVRLLDMNSNGYNEVVLASAEHVDVFTLEAVRVLSPNSGVLRAGDTCRVRWRTFDPPRCDSVSLFLRRDSTWRLDTIATGLAPADTPYCWVVPDIRADSCWLVAIAYGPGWQYDESDSVLRIVGSGVGEEMPRAAYAFRLDAHPNPARNRMAVKYELTCPGTAELAVFDRAGRKRVVLASGRHNRGRYEVNWHCRDEGGALVPAGVYFVRLESPEGRLTLKVVLN